MPFFISVIKKSSVLLLLLILSFSNSISANAQSSNQDISTQKIGSKAKLQADTSQYVCKDNYFGSQANFSSFEKTYTDPSGNTYSFGRDQTDTNYKVSKVNLVGTLSTINIPQKNYKNILANSSGDIFLTFSEQSIFQMYKIPSGTSDLNLIYTFPFGEYGISDGFKIDILGNLYIPFQTSGGIGNQNLNFIAKISSSGTRISTFTLPNLNISDTKHIYDLANFAISASGLIYVATIPSNPSLQLGYSLIVLNTDGTVKGTFEYSSSALPIPDLFQGFATLAPSVTGGGVYATYLRLSTGTLYLKRIMDTDNFPISNSSDLNVFTGSSYAFHEIIVDSTNTYIYYFYSSSLQRLKVSDNTSSILLPPYTSELNIANTSSGDIIFGSKHNSDLFKLDCSSGYPYPAFGINNIDINKTKCARHITTNSVENGIYNCQIYLSKIIGFSFPASFAIRISGSGIADKTDCYYTPGYLGPDIDGYVSCDSLSQGSINTTENRNVEISIDGGPYTTVSTITTWQPFSSWNSTSATISGKSSEIVYNNLLYQAIWGTDNGIYIRSIDTNNVESSWRKLGSITAKGSPTLSIDPNGDLYVFENGTDKGLYYLKIGETGGEKWRRVGSITMQDIPTLYSYNGKYWLYATGTDNGLYVAKFSSFSETIYNNPSWEKAGSITVKNTAQGGVVDDKLYQIVIGTDNSLYYRFANNSDLFSSWLNYDYPNRYSSIGTAIIQNNKLILPFGSGYYAFGNAVFTDFTHIPVKINTSAADGSDGSGISFSSGSVEQPSNIVVFKNFPVEAIKIGSKLLHRNAKQNGYFQNSYSGDWVEGNNITILEAPTQIVYNNKQYQFVHGTDNKLWRRDRN